jgi:Fe-S-cluster containining protein
MTVAANICINCGLCSDGTIFRFVPLRPGESPDALTIAGVAVSAVDDRAAFLLPCAAFRGGCCSIYENRPAVCREYRCSLLRRHEAGEVSFEEARSVIERTKVLRDEVRSALEAALEPVRPQWLTGLYRLLMARFDAAADPAAARRENAALLLDFASLRIVLAREFESETPDASSAEGREGDAPMRVRQAATAGPRPL